MKKYMPWRVLVAFVGLYHLVLGLILLTSGDMAISLARRFAGMTIAGSPELGIMGEILATYVIAFGLLMAAAAWNPEKNRAAITIGLTLICLRLLQRLVFADKMMSVFQIPAGSYWSAFAIVAIIGMALAVFRVLIYRDMHGKQA